MRAFRIAYDGRPFSGFQRQPDVPTVEVGIFDALRELGIFEGEAPPGYAAAGRTDAGVSALAQTVAFEAPAWCSPAALNSELPTGVRSWASADVPDGFHATHDAVRREYLYHLYAPDLDDGLARDALARLSGEHDFHNLTPDDRGTVRDVAATAERDGEFLVVRVAAGGFARELVRRIVSLARAVGAGSAPLSKVGRVLGDEVIDGPAGVPPAPPEPLVLVDVVYPDVEFTVDESSAPYVREWFDERRVAGLVAARVGATIRDGVG
ncbi:MAG: tRNA pseudouridine(38-40) synthase TruA [Salinigranum sp.]